jgi:ATP-dependent helicase/nuclease subunit A
VPGRRRALFEQRSLAVDLRPADAAAADLWALHAAAYDRWWARLGLARLAPSEIERLALRAVEAPALAARIVARAPRAARGRVPGREPAAGRLFEALERAGARIEVVGDPKQSIYGFRHADVEVFRRAARTAAAAGTLDPPLAESRRHAPEVAALLNLVTGRLAAEGLGFGPEEAPDVRPVGARAQVGGRVELHWWRDDDGTSPGSARPSSPGSPVASSASRGRGGRGRRWPSSRAPMRRWRPSRRRCARRGSRRCCGRAAATSSGPSCATSLTPSASPSTRAGSRWRPGSAAPSASSTRASPPRSPAPTPRSTPCGRGRRRSRTASRLRGPPCGPIPRGRSPCSRTTLGSTGAPYVAWLAPRARDNVDALVVELAERPPADLERLLDRLDRLARESDAGDVPQSGEGVALLTVHAAKGLEWPIVAVVDAGRGSYDPPPP